MKKPIPFGKYVLLERINVGGMAEVFKAKAFGVEGFERLVAVKRILPSIAEDAEFITMFIDEAKISVQLTHANVAQIFDLGKVGDSFFIAMEFVHGKDLRAIFDRARKRGETVPVPMACYIAMKVCEGLDYAHNKKDAAGRDLHLVHRDVSPQNCLISYDGETKLIDFGIAKAAGKAGKTQAGILKGKFGYMSPEQVRGLPLDRRSDIFAVGIVLYELLTGERLFVGESDFSTLEKVRNVEIMPPSTYNRRIPEELEQIVLKALAKDVDDRYQTAMDLHDDLQSFMYTSGNFFSRKDLSAYMRKGFADEIAKESAREEEYRRMEADGSLAGGAKNGGSGLEAFADLEPIEASQPSAQMPAPQAKAANVSTQPVPPRPPGPPQKRTMTGMPAVQPPPPPRQSMSAPPPPPPPRASQPEPSPAAAGASDMDWDEEELSTQIYDKPEGLDFKAQPAVEPAPIAQPSPTAQPSPFPAPGRPSLGAAAAPRRPSFPTTSAPMTQPMPQPAPMPMPQPAPLPRGAPSPFDLPPPTIGPEPTAVTRKAAENRSSSSGLVGAISAIAVIAVLGVLAAGVWFVFFRSQPGTIAVSTTPSDPVVYLDGQAVTTSTASPFVIANVEPGQHLVEVRKVGYETWATTVTLDSGGHVSLPSVTLVAHAGAPPRSLATGGPASVVAAAPPAGATGFSLTTVPAGARVFVGDRELPQRTPVQITDLSPGTYQIRVDNGTNYAPWLTQITIASGQVVALPPAVLTLRTVTVQFSSEPPGADVTLQRGSERRSLGRTPLSAEVDVSGGPWTVRMEANGYEDYEAALVLPADQPAAQHAATLVRRHVAIRGGGRERGGGGPIAVAGPTSADPGGGGVAPGGGGGGGGDSREREGVSGRNGTLRINTQPWSQVYVDGRLIGNTPQMAISLSPGRHSVTLVNSDFEIRQTISVEITAGETTTRVVRLTPGG